MNIDTKILNENWHNSLKNVIIKRLIHNGHMGLSHNKIGLIFKCQ